MPSPYMTAKEAAEYLNVPLSTFRLKARTEWKLVPVPLFAGPKGQRYKRPEVEAVALRAEQERDKAQRKACETIAKAAGVEPLRLAG
jgi:hypothetical protein